MQFTIDASTGSGPLRHFWRATGFTPAELLLHDDMQQALTFIAAGGGVDYVRIHYLLDLVSVEGMGGETPVYDWALLDRGLDALVQRGLIPFFELMGNPSGWFTNFTERGMVDSWRRLVRDLARHCIERYGTAEVRRWYFETWNEPDISFWPYSVDEFLNYYDACSEGLNDADLELIFGGPGTCRNLSETLKALLAHCDRGTNYFTGATGVRLDFISVHEKGVRGHPEDLNPMTQDIIDREQRIIDYIKDNHPALADRPFMNDECDPQVGWREHHTWRARPYYAAIVARIIDQHLQQIGPDYGLLSNDNGFLGAWGHRTLLARFGEHVEVGDGQAGYRERDDKLKRETERQRFDLIKKPVLNVMTALARLGETRLMVEGGGDELGLLATRHANGDVALLVYHSRDTIMASGSERVELALRGLAGDSALVAHYRIDDAHGDPYVLWETAGAPDEPDSDLLARMREQHELTLLAEPHAVDVSGGVVELTFDLPLPAVSLILLLQQPVAPPAAVTGLRVERYGSTQGVENVLLAWEYDPTPARRTYIIEHSPTADGPFERVNPVDVVSAAYLIPGAAGCYRVYALDYWGQRGEAAQIDV